MFTKNLQLLKSKIIHQRLIKPPYQFHYPAFHILVNMSEATQSTSLFFSFDKFNLYSFYNKDFSVQKITELLIQHKVKIETPTIFLLTMPRILGYSFNPISIWYVFNQDVLVSIITEVHNTFKEKHFYVFTYKDRSLLNNKLYKDKAFHVSPLLNMDNHYEFIFDNQRNIKVIINEYHQENCILKTSLICQPVLFSNFYLLKNFMLLPFFTLRIVFNIHYQALKIKLRGATYYPKPKKNDQNFS